MMTRTIEAHQSHRLEDAALSAMIAAAKSDVAVLMVFRSVAVLVEPGDDVEEIVAAHDAAVADIVERETLHPLLTDVPPRRGDVVETLEDDHFTRIPKGTIGLVAATTQADDRSAPTAIAVRFAIRGVDYEAADFARLRHLREPVR